MFIDKIKSHIKIYLVLLISFFAAQLFNNQVFIGNSPIVRSRLDKYIAMKFKNTSASLSKTLTLMFNSQAKNTQTIANQKADEAFKALEVIPFQQIAKGTYAKSNESATITLVKLGEIEALEYTFVINGQTVHIRVPKDANVTEAQLREQLGAN